MNNVPLFVLKKMLLFFFPQFFSLMVQIIQNVLQKYEQKMRFLVFYLLSHLLIFFSILVTLEKGSTVSVKYY